MTRARRSVPPPAPPARAPVDLAALADRVLAQDVVTAASWDELAALLIELRARGYRLKRRTEWEQRDTPWLLLVEPVPAETSTPDGAA